MMKKTAFLCALLLCLWAVAFAGAGGMPSFFPLPARYGDQGANVRQLQEELTRLGYYQGEADGRYSMLTVHAVEQFQKARNLFPDGQAGDITLLALFARIAFSSPLADIGSQIPTGEPAIQEAQGIPQESGPGERGSHVKQLQQALISRSYLPSGGADSVFAEATLQAVTVFQRDSGLRETGRADRDTLQALFTQPQNIPGDTQMPTWYGGGSDLIPWGAVFEVKDVRTGIRFTCYRLMGISHLDAEPLTPFDTMAMEEAYGGKWSWDRRPILLYYRGEVYAASMSGMPHSYQSNRTNNMPGHFCIHFFGSRGDSSQRIDVEHLQCAFEASFARWEDMPPAEAQP